MINILLRLARQTKDYANNTKIRPHHLITFQMYN